MDNAIGFAAESSGSLCCFVLFIILFQLEFLIWSYCSHVGLVYLWYTVMVYIILESYHMTVFYVYDHGMLVYASSFFEDWYYVYYMIHVWYLYARYMSQT